MIISEERLNSFTEEIINCFAARDGGWTGLVFDTEEIREVIIDNIKARDREESGEGDNELTHSKLMSLIEE